MAGSITSKPKKHRSTTESEKPRIVPPTALQHQPSLHTQLYNYKLKLHTVEINHADSQSTHFIVCCEDAVSKLTHTQTKFCVCCLFLMNLCTSFSSAFHLHASLPILSSLPSLFPPSPHQPVMKYE